MKTSALMDLINDLEARYEVDQWTFNSIHLWPFIRIRLGFDLFEHFHTNVPSRTASVSFLGRARQFVGNNLKFVQATLSDAQMNTWPTKQAEIVFISDGVSYAQLETTWYEKFCDPIRSILERQGRTTFMISPLHEYFVPRHSPSLFIQPCLDLIKARNYLFPRSGEVSDIFLREHSDCCAYLASRALPASLMDMRMIQAYALMIQGIADLYSSVLRRLEPSLVFLVSYYSIEGMAATLACRRLNIPSVDIQHGFQGNLHLAYARWNRVPEKGYELLPSCFWCWSEDDVSTIRKWSVQVDRWHHPVAGGNVWMSMWQRGTLDNIDRYDAALRQVLDLHPGARHILVTLQPGLSDQTMLTCLLGSVQQGDQNWRWWFRLHPCMHHDRQRIKDLLHRNAITDYELDLASDLPLYALLRHLDLHITHSSSTVIEAQQFGIPSVIIHELGTELFPEQIRSGWAQSAFTAEQIIKMIRVQFDARNRLPQPTPDLIKSSDESVVHLITMLLDHHNSTADLP